MVGTGLEDERERKDKLRAQLAKDVDEFLAKGGKVQVVASEVRGGIGGSKPLGLSQIRKMRYEAREAETLEREVPDEVDDHEGT
jgi:hypothetical protein